MPPPKKVSGMIDLMLGLRSPMSRRRLSVYVGCKFYSFVDFSIISIFVERNGEGSLEGESYSENPIYLLYSCLLLSFKLRY
jgi:hypothetical protein